MQITYYIKKTTLKFIDKIISLFPQVVNKLSTRYYPYDLININLDLTQSKQKKVLICYLNILGVDMTKLSHPAYAQLNQIILYFIRKNYCIDICDSLDMKSYNRLKHNKYDIILGFGKVFKSFCQLNKIKKRIIFITENHPEIVKEKYNERICYFKKRHPKISIDNAIPRNQYFDKEQIELANFAILMSSKYNAISFNNKINKLWTINSNILLNENFNFDKAITLSDIKHSKYNFLWLGSIGFIHKGVDLLLDAFKDMPEFTLNCYGISKYEKSLFDKLSSENTKNRGFINIWNEDFIQDVVKKHNFMIFPSCSEGMSTAVATCMAHGIIPIITKETGFNSTSCIIELDNYKITTIQNTIRELQMLEDEVILEKRKLCYEYAVNNFNIKRFNENINNILDKILEV